MPLEITEHRKALDSIPMGNRTQEQIQELETLLEEYSWGPQLSEAYDKYGWQNYDATVLLNP